MPPKVVTDKLTVAYQADYRSSLAFTLAIAAGFTSPTFNITMQTDKRDYEMMDDGLQTMLDAPANLGGAAGDTTVVTTVFDKDNNHHQLTIADAQILAQEMRFNYWSLWKRKGEYRIALKACATVADMDQIQF